MSLTIEKKPDIWVGSIFIKDPLSVVGNIVIGGGNRVPFRRKEVFGYRHILRERVLGSDAKWICMPPSMPDSRDVDGGEGPFLTGGDIFPFGNNNFCWGTTASIPRCSASSGLLRS